MNKSNPYNITLTPCEEGGYVAEVLELKGCITQGETLKETLNELANAIELWEETSAKNKMRNNVGTTTKLGIVGKLTYEI